MEIEVRFTARARDELREIVAWIHADSPLNAIRWRRRMFERLRTLKTMATIFGMAPENRYARVEVRQVLLGKYRVLYTISDETVFILTIRHGARQFLTREEIDGIVADE